MLNKKYLNIHNIGIAIGFLVFLVSVLSAIAAAQTNITECTTIMEPGEYELTRNLTSEGTCIEITSSDVVFNGDAYEIRGYGASGVIISSSTISISNVTVKNLTVSNFDRGIYLDSISLSNLSYNTMEGNNYGIYMANSHNNNLSNNAANSNQDSIEGYGIYLSNSDDNYLISNTANSNGGHGDGPNVEGYGYGIYLSNSNDNYLFSNTANSNFGSYGDSYGIYLTSSNGNNLSSNNATSNGGEGARGYGIYLLSSSNNNLGRNTVESNDYGIYLGNSLENNIANNRVSNNLVQGISLFQSDNNTITRNTANNNIDTIPPEVIGHSPVGSDISVSTTISVTFNEAMDGTSVDMAFSISPSVEGSYSWSGNTMTYTPNSDLNYDTAYTISVGTGAQDLNGNSLANPYSWEFTTQPPELPVIVTHPEDKRVGWNTTATFSVVATSTTPMTYQWQKNEEDIPGATGATYTTPLTSCDEISAQYRVIVSNSAGSVPSNSATLEVSCPNGVAIQGTTGEAYTTQTMTQADNGALALTSESDNGVGIYLYSSSNNNLSDNKVKNNYFGIYMNNSQENNITDNNASNNIRQGISLLQSENNRITGNTANSNYHDQGNAYGIYLFASNNNKISENTANSNEGENGYGIYLFSSNNNLLSSNTASNNSGYEGNGFGIHLSTSNDNNLSRNTVTLNGGTGIYIYNSSNNNFNSDNAFLNGNFDFYLGSGSMNNEILNLNQTISFIGEDVIVDSYVTAPSDPPGGVYHNISKYVSVTNTSANSWIFLNVSYDHTDLSNLNESTLRMWEYDGSSWSQVSGLNDVNKEQNYVYANITRFSIFAPMGIDDIPPAIAFSSPQNITYAKAVIPLNVSADEEVSNWIYNLNGRKNISFIPNASIVGARGTNTLVVHAKDTAGNWNSSIVNFTVDLTLPANITILSPENNSINKTGNVSVMVSLDTLVDTVILNWDGVNESNPMEEIPNDEGKILYKGNKTGIFSGNFSLRVYARDLNGNFNVSETIFVEVDRSTIFNFSDYIENGTIIKDLVIPVLNDTDILNTSSLIIFHNTKMTFNCENDNTFKRNRLQKLDSSIDPLVDYGFGGENVTFEPVCDPEIPNPQTRFIPDAQIRFHYTHDQLKALNIEDRENELTVKYYNSSKNMWEDVEPETIISRDIVLNIITVNTSHLSVFALAVPAVAVSTESPSGGGGSVGGAGVVTKEPYENIEKFEIETKDINDFSSSAYRYTFQYGIYEILVNGKNVIDDVSIRVELLKGQSKLVKEPAPGIVHFYQNIWSSTKDVKDVIIRFREDNSWITSQNISNVKMTRWDGSKWISLETKQTNKDGSYTYFEAWSDGFSSFAVIGEKVTITPEPTSQTSNITLEEKAPGISPTNTPPSGPPVNWNYILIVLALILGFIIIFLGVSGPKPIKSVSSEQFTETSQEAYGAKYYEYLLEQYKLYVITTDKIKERQQYTNNYFLIFNSIFVTIFGVLSGFASMTKQHMWQYLLLFAGFLVSITWGTFLSHNREYNSVRLALLHEIESKLPMELHSSENKIMDESKGNQYLKYSILEQYIPWIFAGLYTLLIVLVISGIL